MRNANWKGVAVLMIAVLIALAGLAAWGVMRLRSGVGKRPAVGTGLPSATVTPIDFAAAPQDVQAAALALKTSKVGYSIVKPNLTYVIVSTGDENTRLQLGRMLVQSVAGRPSLAEIFLESGGAGQSLMILTTRVGAGVEYQLNVDSRYAAIPMLYNPDNLPLTALPDSERFVLVSPAQNQLVQGFPLRIAGYARVFEARFTARLITGKGRVIGEVHPMAAAGAPNWGSFVAEFDVSAAELPDQGFLVLEEEMSGSRIQIPVRFSASDSPQLG